MRGTRWQPGPDHGLAWSGGLAVLDGGLDPQVADSLWEILTAGADIADFLDALTRTCGHGLSDLPGFAIAFIGQDSTTVAARGRFAVDLTIGSGEEHVDGAGSSIWAERRLPAATTVTVAGAAPATPAVPRPPNGRPVASGVVPAAAMTWRHPATVAAAPAAVEPVGVGSPPAEPPGPESAVAASDGAEAGIRGVAEPAREAGDGVDGVDADRQEALGEPASGRRGAAGRDPGETGGTTLEPDWDRAAADVPRRLWLVPTRPGEPGPAEHSAATELARAVHHPSVGVHAPAAKPAAAADADGFIAVVPDFSRPVPAPLQATGVPAVEAAPAPALPEAPPRPGRTPPTPAEHTTYAHDDAAADATRMRAEITSPVHLVPGREFPAAVLAAFCPDGHANPPQRVQCRVCRAPVDGPPRQIPQPSVGRLVASTGEAFDLTGTVVAGRAPRASAAHVTSPRLLALPYGHISGSHLEIRVEGWSVLAQDLSSTNGTFLRRGNQPPVRLPEVPIPIFQGDTLDFGDGVRISFENLP